MGDGRSLFIACLPRDTREEDVKSVFKRYGPIVSCDIRSGALRKRSSSLMDCPLYRWQLPLCVRTVRGWTRRRGEREARAL